MTTLLFQNVAAWHRHAEQRYRGLAGLTRAGPKHGISIMTINTKAKEPLAGISGNVKGLMG